MPKTGMAMEEGTIIRWLKREGESIEKGEPIAEIETDKSTMDLEAEAAGILLRILHSDGETVAVSRVIGWIGKQGEAVPREANGAPAAVAAGREAAGEEPSWTAGGNAAEMDGPIGASFAGKVAATPSARRVAAENKIDLGAVTPSGWHGEVRERDVQASGRVAVSPLAKKIAADTGIPLTGVRGTGPGGRITRADLPVEAAAPEGLLLGRLPVEATGDDRRVPLTQIQKITGKRTLQSHLEIPPVTCQAKADVSELLLVRERMNAAAQIATTGGMTRTSINDWVLMAVARALLANPRLNSILDGGDVIYRKAIDIGIAVATPRGLLVPVLRSVDTLTLGNLSAATRDLFARAKEGKLSPRELESGTFSVSNMGMYGITAFTPIINQPQVAILGVCAIEQELRMIDGQVTARSLMGLNLTFDHRVIDGAEAAIFLKCLKEQIENPLAMLF